MNARSTRVIAVSVGILLVLLGLGLTGAGLWLALLGGSLFYVPMGLGLAASGWFVVRGATYARTVYAALLLATLIWAVAEVGLDWWALAPRGALLSVIGIALLLPWFDGNRAGIWSGRRLWLRGRVPLVGSIAAVAIVALVAVTHDRFKINGTLDRPARTLASAEPVGGDDWPVYGGDRFGRRFSSLGDITPANANRLEVAWTYHTGENGRRTDPLERTFEVTPLKIGDSVYLCTARNKVIALDATTGRERWTFDPEVRIDQRSEHLTCRGISYYADPAVVGMAVNTLCRDRLIVPTMDARLFALDARTGRRCPGFGTAGEVSLMAGMPNAKSGFYMVTSPPVVVGDLAIFGAAINDNVSLANPSGVIRAYDVHSGALRWNWDPGSSTPNAMLKPGETYSAGAPNMWSVGSADPALGLVYLPLGNTSPDQWGVNRSPESERFGSAIVALDIASGRLRWVAQTVHHDLWDRDVPSQPTLVDIDTPAGPVPALVGPTKQGDLFVLDRRTGKPVFPIKEKRFAGSAVTPDRASPTQPVSALSFMPPPLQERDMWGGTPFDQLACRILFRSKDYTGPYTPPSLKGAIIYPGNTGVFNWGGIAVDPRRQIMIGSPVRLAFVSQLVPRPEPTGRVVTTAGKGAFGENFGGPYAVKLGPLVSPLGLPCQAPPWGSLVGASLKTGATVWRHRNGTTRDDFPLLPIKLRLGMPSLGGPMITAGGVFFYAGTLDNYLRAYAVDDGRLLWEGRLPAGGQATPMTYRAADNRQMVVIAAGGHGSLGTKLGDAVIAYALPSHR